MSFKIVGFGGSLRKGSYNRAVLESAQELVPDGVEFEILEIEGIPIYDQDSEKNMPKPVRHFKARIKAADAIVIETPEYNYSVPGFLKNAIDWASRPYGDNSFNGKPVAIISASGGMLGGARAQYHLRQMLVFLNMHPINKPEVMISHVHEKIDKSGKLVDEETRKKIREQMEELVSWTERIRNKG